MHPCGGPDLSEHVERGRPTMRCSGRSTTRMELRRYLSVRRAQRMMGTHDERGMKAWSDCLTGSAIVLLLLLITQPDVALAHEDRLIRLASDGRLQGLPPEYEPAHLHLPPVNGTEHVVLQLGAKRLEFPDCLS